MSHQWEMKKNVGTQPAADQTPVDYMLGGSRTILTAEAGCIDWSLDVMPPHNVVAWKLHVSKIQIDPEDVEFGGETPADLHATHFNEPLVTDEEMAMLNTPMDYPEEVGIVNTDVWDDSHLDVMEQQVGGNHYKEFAIQPWDIIDCYMLNFYEGNVIKYMLRIKGARLEDLKKARHYLDKLIQDVEGE